jgi:predicted Zn-dependent protease
VLLHEAVGHAAESGAAGVTWPGWLEVRDVPTFAHDDAGNATVTADLMSGERPGSWRRETFRDVPQQRMANLIVAAPRMAWDLPPTRIEIEMVGGGHYDAIRDEIELHVSAARLVRDNVAQPLRPFGFSATRSEIAAALRASSGVIERYPGVICSREGQDVYVGSAAPALLTVFA